MFFSYCSWSRSVVKRKGINQTSCICETHRASIISSTVNNLYEAETTCSLCDLFCVKTKSRFYFLDVQRFERDWVFTRGANTRANNTVFLRRCINELIPCKTLLSLTAWLPALTFDAISRMAQLGNSVITIIVPHYLVIPRRRSVLLSGYPENFTKRLISPTPVALASEVRAA